MTDKIEALREKATGLVKPLEWTEMPERPLQYKGFLLSKIKTVSALIEYGITYAVQGELDRFGKPWTDQRADYPRYEVDAPIGGSGNFSTLEEAKAAAQADYERRILSALDLSELDRLRSSNEAMRKALQEIAKVTRGDDLNNPPEVRAEYYAGRFFTAQNTARAALSLQEEEAR